MVMKEQEDSYKSFEYTAYIDLFREYNERLTNFENHDITLKLAFQQHLVTISMLPKDEIDFRR